MSDGVFNISKGRVVEKIADSGSALGVVLLKANETEDDLIDRTDISNLLAQAGNTEADFTNYARKTGVAGTITIDNINNRVDVDIPNQVFTSAGGASNNTMTKLIVYYEESASDAGRIPLTHHDFTPTTDGSDLTAQINASGFYRSS